MGEERYQERVLKEWLCGYREWCLQIVAGDVLEDEVTENIEGCRELASLVENEEREERRADSLFLEKGPQSPEYVRAHEKHVDTMARIVNHFDDAVPSIKILEVYPYDED